MREVRRHGVGRADGPGEPWPARVDTCLDGSLRETDVEEWVRSVWTLHCNSDAVDLAVKDGRIVGVRADDRVDRGRLDPEDVYGRRANHSGDRLTRPPVREGGRLVGRDWDTAMGRAVERSQQRLHGPGERWPPR
jgi:hypothetical protein